MRLFARHGYDGVGVAELSEALGVNPPSLYAAFGSKRGLFERAVELYRERYEAAVPAVLASEPRLEDAVARLFAVAAKAYTDDPDSPGCMIIEGTRSAQDPGACTVLGDAQRSTRGLILDRLRTDGAPDPEVLADYVLVVLSGLSAAARRGTSGENLSEVAAIAAQGFAARLASADGQDHAAP